MGLVEMAKTAAQGDGQGEAATALVSWAGGDGGNQNQGAISGSGQEQSLALPPAAKPQFSFYVNERGNRVFMVPRKPNRETGGGP